MLSKTGSISLSFLVGFVSAGYQQMNEQLEILMQNMTTTQIDRDLVPLLGPQLQQINKYGCWCYFDPSDFNMGRGDPINGVDRLCRILHEGYKCAILDGKDEGEKCVPYEVQYLDGSNRGLGKLHEKCAERNPDNACAERACIIEGHFVLSIFMAFFNPAEKHSLQFLHENGFDRDSECFNSKAGQKSEPFCCGNYPIRKPYNNKDGNKKCCGSLSYNADVLSCCDTKTEEISMVC